MNKKILLFTIVLLCVAKIIFAMPEKPINYVSDFAGVIRDTVESSLNSELASYEKMTGIELAVATVSSLDNQAVDEYTLALFKKWGVGKKQTNNGMLLVWCPNERKYWATTGYGMEGDLPDVTISRIQRALLLPDLKAGTGDLGVAKFMRGIMSELGYISPERREEIRKASAEAKTKAEAQLAELQLKKDAETKEIVEDILMFLIFILSACVLAYVIFKIVFMRKEKIRLAAERREKATCIHDLNSIIKTAKRQHEEKTQPPTYSTSTFDVGSSARDSSSSSSSFDFGGGDSGGGGAGGSY